MIKEYATFLSSHKINMILDKPTLADSNSRRAKSLGKMKTTGELRAGLCERK